MNNNMDAIESVNHYIRRQIHCIYLPHSYSIQHGTYYKLITFSLSLSVCARVCLSVRALTIVFLDRFSPKVIILFARTCKCHFHNINSQ